jgi:hypothetical protein
VRRVVVAACLHRDAAHNPDAPEVILCGSGKLMVAAGGWLAAQTGAIPVFVYHAPHRWEYCGDFEVESSHTQGAEFDKWVSRGTRPASAISRVIVLRRVLRTRQREPPRSPPRGWRATSKLQKERIGTAPAGR